ncbi:MAG: hypothetical protein M1491_01745, partial [Deltaproteobacteria bacterium]|nr:hypothetical protein [Deltaproteobacteria bacterium]
VYDECTNIVDTDRYKNSITERLRASYYPYRTGTSEVFLRHFLDSFHGIECVFMYGSMLNPGLSTPTSYPDFYIIVDSYAGFYGSRVHTLLNMVLPPNSYFLELSDNGTSMPSKYCVIDKRDLYRCTHYPHIKDFFISGRLAKRIAILYAKDGEFLSGFIDSVYHAMHFNVMFALSDLACTGGFSFDDFMLKLLGLSYRAEVRTETQDKIAGLYAGERDFYRDVYGKFLEQEILGRTVEKTDGTYRTVRPYSIEPGIAGFISRSRRRAVYRWPKSIYTFSNYVDYLALKVERTTGENLRLSKWDRRLPLVFGWRHLFRLLKKKAIR